MVFEVSSSQRLDIFVSEQLAKSRNAVSELIRAGFVAVNGKPATKPSFALKPSDQVTVLLPEPKAPDQAIAVDFEVPVLYEDESFLIINKPANLVVHPATSHKGATLVDWLQSKNYTLSTISGETRNGIVHRLDKETTGGLIIAKNDVAHQKIAAQLEDRSAGRYYIAVIDQPLKDSLIVEKPLARHPTKRTKMAVVPNGKEAKTAFVKLAEFGKFELIAAQIFTGRTHQIRVHLGSLNRHIVGDEMYGYKQKSDFFLHAYKLEFVHPRSAQTVSFIAPLPDHFTKLLSQHFTKEKIDEITSASYISSCFDALFGLCKKS